MAGHSQGIFGSNRSRPAGRVTPNCWRCCSSRAPPARWSRGGAAWSDGATSHRCCRSPTPTPTGSPSCCDDFSQDVRTVQAPVLSIRNGRRSVVITGTPEQLTRFELYCTKITEKEEAERKNKLRGGAVFRPAFNRILVRGRLPHAAAGRRRRPCRRVGARCSGLDAELARVAAPKPSSSTRSTGSPRSSGLHEAGARWILDLGPERHRDPADRAGDPRPRHRHRRPPPPAAGSATCSPPAPSPRSPGRGRATRPRW